MARLAAALVFAALLAAGCAGSGDEGASAEELVAESAERTGEIQTFRFTLDVLNVPITAEGLQITSAEGDVAVPDKAQADVTGNFAGISLTTQVVAIGDDVWLKNPLTGDWETIDISTTPIALLDPTEGILGVMAGINGAKDDGTDELDDVTVRKVTGTAEASAVAPLVATSADEGEVPVTLWIGEEDKLLRRVDVMGPVAGDEPDDAQRSFEISRFDEPVTIEPPDGSG